MHPLKFFMQSMRDWKTIGTPIPSSLTASRKMADPVDFGSARVVVELGAGSGPITKELLKRLHPEARLFVFERIKGFADLIREFDDPRLTVINDSAEKLLPILASYGVEKVDAVISTLPLALMEKEVRENIFLAVSKILHPGSPYVQIQYSLLSRRELKKSFSRVDLRFTLLNFPPSFFYTCKV